MQAWCGDAGLSALLWPGDLRLVERQHPGGPYPAPRPTGVVPTATGWTLRNVADAVSEKQSESDGRYDELVVVSADVPDLPAPRRSLIARGPDWHRMRTAGAIDRLGPGLEGWETTRALLSGHALVE